MVALLQLVQLVFGPAFPQVAQDEEEKVEDDCDFEEVSPMYAPCATTVVVLFLVGEILTRCIECDYP